MSVLHYVDNNYIGRTKNNSSIDRFIFILQTAAPKSQILTLGDKYSLHCMTAQAQQEAIITSAKGIYMAAESCFGVLGPEEEARGYSEIDVAFLGIC